MAMTMLTQHDEQNENRHDGRENGRLSLVVPGPLSPRGERRHPNEGFEYFRGEPQQEKSNGL